MLGRLVGWSVIQREGCEKLAISVESSAGTWELSKLSNLRINEFYMDFACVFHVVFHVLLEKTLLGGVFKYLFIFTPIWGRFPF